MIYIIIAALATIIIISHFLNIFSDKTGVPSVLILILFGMLLQLDQVWFNFEIIDKSIQKPLLKMLGTGGLILILLEAALDLKFNKTMISSSIKAFISGSMGLIFTALIGAYILQYWFKDLNFLAGLFFATPLAILSSAIIIPSTHTFPEDKKSFLIYESTFSDVLGLLMFEILLGVFAHGNISSSKIIGELGLSIIFSIGISIILIYVFQKIKSTTKLFLLFAILMLLYSIGHALKLSALLIVLIFGLILNNYEAVFKGVLSKFINHDSVNNIQDGFKIIIQESAFVVRTFFFIVFGYYVALEKIIDPEFIVPIMVISLMLLAAIYLIRFLILLPTLRTSTWPEVFLAPRGLITILLFFSIPETLLEGNSELINIRENIIPGVFLCVILGSTLAMSNALIGFKKLQTKLLNRERKTIEISNISEFLSEEEVNIEPVEESQNEEEVNVDPIEESQNETNIEKES